MLLTVTNITETQLPAVKKEVCSIWEQHLQFGSCEIARIKAKATHWFGSGRNVFVLSSYRQVFV